MRPIKIGVQIHPQQTTYAAYRDAWLRADALGLDSIWNWDHFFPLYGDRDGPHFEGWTTLAARGAEVKRAQVGCLVLCMSYRNPALLSQMAKTLDHATGGRLILGVGAGWHQRDYEEYGFPFGTAGDRLRTLERGLETVKERWRTDLPKPLRGAVPIMVGGDGERVTLRIAALHADAWNGFGPPEAWARRNRALDAWCAEVGREPASIERTAYIGRWDLDRLDAYAAAGATHLIYGLGAPFPSDPIDRLLAWRARQTEA